MHETALCTRCNRAIAEEFQWEKLQLEHSPPDDFVQCQFQRGMRSVWWLIYRWAMAIFFTGVVALGLSTLFVGGKYFIYFTHWGLFLCMFTNILGAVLVTLHYRDPLTFVNGSRWLKFYWIMHYTTVVAAVIVSVVFWVALFPNATDDLKAFDTFNLCAHVANIVLMLLDLMLVAFPLRLLHTIYPLIFIASYGVFTVIYYFAGGTDYFGNAFVYPILDWSKPGLALTAIAAIAVMILAFPFLLFGLYKLRCALHRRTTRYDVSSASPGVTLRV